MKQVARIVREFADLLADRAVLEIACGTAEFSLECLPFASSVTATDLDLSRLDPRCRSRKELAVLQADARHLPFPNSRFDTVVFYNALAHLADDIDAVFAESTRVCIDNGVVLCISTWKLDRPFYTALGPLTASLPLTTDNKGSTQAYQFLVLRKRTR